MAEEGEDSRVAGKLRCLGVLAGTGPWGWVSWRCRGFVVPKGMGEALEDFDTVGELEVFGVRRVWGGAACANVFEEDGEVAQAPEKGLGAAGQL